ncbi:MAG: hypothetical protein ABJO80_11475 [Sulfitobacter sp.]
MSEGVFDEAADNFLGALPDFATEANALASDVNAKASTATGAASTATTKAGEAATSASNASDSADDAATYRDAAAAAAGASEWVSEASYTANVSAVVSPVNQQTYRAKTTHSGVATDPSSDATNWTVLTIDGGDYASLSSAIFTGPLKTLELQETVVAIASGATPSIDCEAGTVFTLTVTGTTTPTFDNPPATGTAAGFTLILTNGGSQTFNWPASVDWPAATAPTLTAAGVDVLTFFTRDGGTTWHGFAAGTEMG